MTQIVTPAAPSPDDRPHRPADDSEEVYFDGSPLLRAEMGKVILWGIAGVILLAIAITNLVHWHFDWPWWLYLVLVGLGVASFFVPIIMRRTVRYRITNYRIDVTYGMLSRNVDTIELWHVEDLRLHQSLMNRMVGVGSITVSSHDQNVPVLPLRGLPNPQNLFKMLEQRVIAVKRQRGVMKVDPG